MEDKSRLEQIKEFVEMDPADTFARYALGMEYLGISEFGESVRQFEEVIHLDPDYSSAYFQAAIASQNMKKMDEAAEFLRKGIEVAEKKGEWHARDEMKEALDAIEEESKGG
jgi:Tfp pilus assembly protein PilF